MIFDKYGNITKKETIFFKVPFSENHQYVHYVDILLSGIDVNNLKCYLEFERIIWMISRPGKRREKEKLFTKQYYFIHTQRMKKYTN